MTTISDIESIVESLSASQIKDLMATVKSNKRVSVDTSRRAKRIAKTELYFSVAPLPYKSTYEEYKDHSDSIREQVISGVDL